MSELVGRTLELLAETKEGFLPAIKNIFNTKTMATLKTIDLSVGDWVRCRGRNGRIERLEVIRQNERIRVAVESVLGTMYQFVDIEDIDPIPITAEILEKNGISKTYESDEYAVYKGEGFNVTKYYTELWEFEKRRNRLMIRNVHQLQHALGLAGIDIEIYL